MSADRVHVTNHLLPMSPCRSPFGNLRNRAVPLVALAIVVCVCAMGQGAATPQESAPFLRSTARTVLLDVVVTDSGGQPVRHLSASDFVVKEDGVPQRTSLVEGPEVDAATPQTGHGADTSSIAASGIQAERSTQPRMRTLILLDEVNVQFFDLAFARKRLDVFLQSPAARSQPVGLLALTRDRLVLVHDFSTDTDALRRSLAALPPAMPASGGIHDVDEYTDFDNFTHAIGALETIARSLQGAPLRTNCIWITSGFLSMAKLVNSTEVTENFNTIMQHTANLYLGARMSVYTIDPHGVQFESNLPNHNSQPYQGRVDTNAFAHTTGSEFSGQQINMTPNSAVVNSFLGQLDERTGGRGYANQNFIDVPLTEAVHDAESSYLLSYTPQNRDFHGEYRKIRVELRTPGLHARTRDGYLATEHPEEHTAEDVRNLLERALESPLPYQGLRTHATLANANGRPVLRVSVAPAEVEWAANEQGGGRVQQVIAVAAYSEANRPLFNREFHVTTDRTDLQSRQELTYTLPFALPAKTARLRIAVLDVKGTHLGTADVDLPHD